MFQPARSKPVLLGTTYQTTLEGQIVIYNVKRSSRAKNARLEVSVRSGLTVVIPRTASIEDIPRLLKNKARWILDKLAKYAGGQSTSGGKEIKNGDRVPYLGRYLKVVARHNPGAVDGVKQEKNRLLIDINSENGRLNLLLERWYQQQAEKIIRERADALCPQMGVNYSRLTIRDQRTRWGSCSKKGNLNFNWKLMTVPVPVIEYVVIHELAHLKEMNHSKNFWKIVAEHCPKWRSHRKWLKRREAELSAKPVD